MTKSYFKIMNKTPSGALTSKSYSFSPRPWELKMYEVFDPISEFYEPLLVGVANNKVYKVLPINNFLGLSSYITYNWISNRLRFLFENISIDKNKSFSPALSINSWIYKYFENQFIQKSGCIFTSWSFIINILSSKISNFKFFSRSVFLFSRYQNFDIYSMISFYRLLNIKPSTFKFFSKNSLKENTNTFNFFWPMMQNFSNPNLLERYSVLILIGVNVYFLNPNLHYQIKKKVQGFGLNVYTFLSFNFGFSFSYKNTIPTLDSIKMFFSGRHKWSKLGINKKSTIILDYNILITWPEDLKFLIFQFWRKYPQNINLINNKNNSLFFSLENFGTSLFLNSKDIIFNNLTPWINFFFFMNYTSEEMKKDFNSSNYVKSSSSIPEILDYNTIFEFNKINFTTISESVENLKISGCNSNYFIPISEFSEFTSSYHIGVPRIQNKFITNTSESKPFGQYLFILGKMLVKSKNYIHNSKYIKIDFFFYFIFWFFYGLGIIGVLTILSFSFYTYFNNYYFAKPAVYDISTKFFFTSYKNNLYKFFYLKRFSFYKKFSNQVVSTYYYSWFVNPNLGFLSKDKWGNSRALLLDRNYFYSRFINFKK